MKKTLAILVALCLFVALLAGCTGGSGDSTTTAATTTAAATTAVTTTAAGTTAATTTAAGTTAATTTPDANAAAGSYPIVSEPVTYTALVSANSQYADDWNDYTTIQYMSDYTNILFDWQYITSTDWETQLNLKLAGADIPDMIYDSLSTSQLQTYGSEGGYFLDYTPYLNENMPNMVNAFTTYPELKSYATMLDGGIYQLPEIIWTYTMASPIYYRGDHLAEMGASVPTTTTEFYDFLVAAKAQYASVDGYYPIESNYDNLHNNLFPAFGDGYQLPFGDNGDGKVSYNKGTDQWRNYLTYMAKLYQEGLIDKEIFTMDAATINAKVKAAQCSVIGGVGTQLTADYYASGKIETKVLPPLTSEYTSEQKSIGLNTLNWCGKAINKDCANPEYLMRYFDLYYTTISEEQDGICGITSWLGVKGVDWDVSEDGTTYSRILPSDTKGLSEEEYKNKYVMGGGYCGLVVLDLFPINNPTQEMKSHESADSYYPYMKARLFDSAFKYTDDENAELASMITDLNTYVDTSTAQFITGVTPLDDANWANYLATLEKMNLTRILELKQAGYDRWNSAE
ncbi:MAG: hypothetical protein VB111_08430 [Clostridiaceae bacterium]|nr:hypothetical protein [Clostridiaceae bacterium]